MAHAAAAASTASVHAFISSRWYLAWPGHTHSTVVFAYRRPALFLLGRQTKAKHFDLWCLVSVEVGRVNVKADDGATCCRPQSKDDPIKCRIVAAGLPAVKEGTFWTELALHAGCWTDLPGRRCKVRPVPAPVSCALLTFRRSDAGANHSSEQLRILPPRATLDTSVDVVPRTLAKSSSATGSNFSWDISVMGGGTRHGKAASTFKANRLGSTNSKEEAGPALSGRLCVGRYAPAERARAEREPAPPQHGAFNAFSPSDGPARDWLHQAQPLSFPLDTFSTAAVNPTPAMNGPRFFTAPRKGENFELRADLNSEYRDRRKDAIKRVIANMTVGKDVSGLFPDVLKNMQTDDLEQKKLVYLYLMNYAKTQPELVILAVNTFVKVSRRAQQTVQSLSLSHALFLSYQDADDPNPLVRALAIRTMSCLRAEKIIDYLSDPLQKCLRDDNPYVRKTAAICVAKLYEMKPELAVDNGFVGALRDMVGDSNPMVSIYAAFSAH